MMPFSDWAKSVEEFEFQTDSVTVVGDPKFLRKTSDHGNSKLGEELLNSSGLKFIDPSLASVEELTAFILAKSDTSFTARQTGEIPKETLLVIYKNLIEMGTGNGED